MDVEITVSGEKDVAMKLLRFANRADDMKPALEDVADDFYKMQTKQFDSQGAHIGGKRWKSLSPNYLSYKRKAELDLRILHATLDLRKSLTSSSAEGAVKEVSSNSLYVGTDIPYAKYHKNKRPPIRINDFVRRNWVKILQRHLIEGGGTPR